MGGCAEPPQLGLFDSCLLGVLVLLGCCVLGFSCLCFGVGFLCLGWWVLGWCLVEVGFGLGLGLGLWLGLAPYATGSPAAQQAAAAPPPPMGPHPARCHGSLSG